MPCLLPRIMRTLLVAFVVASPAFGATVEMIPSSAPAGARVVIVGPLPSTPLEVTFQRIGGGRSAAVILSRTSTMIESRVPVDATSGMARITASGAEIAAVSFTVSARPGYVKVVHFGPPSQKKAFKQPRSVAVRSDGTVFVADTGNHQIRAVTPHGTSVVVVAGTGSPGLTNGSAAQARFKEPAGVAYDAVRSFLYVADSGNHVIRKINADGIVSTFAGSGRPEDDDGTGGAAGFKRPMGIAIDAAGNLYVADSGNDIIRKITPEGVVTTLAGAGRPGHGDGVALQGLFHRPEGIAVTPDGTLYVSDTKNHVLRRIADGVVSTIAGTRHGGFQDGLAALAELKEPSGIGLDEQGNLIVADAKNDRVRLATIGGASTVTTIAGAGALDAEFKEPSGVAIAGAIFVADTKNDALRVLYPELRATDVYPRASDPAGGTTARLFGSGFVPGATVVTIGGRAAGVTWVSASQLLVTVPAGTIGRSRIVVTTPAGTAVLDDRFEYTLPYAALQVTPASALLRTGETLQLAASAMTTAGNAVDVTSQAAWITSDERVVSIGADGLLRANTSGSATVTATFLGLSASMTVEVREDTPPPTDDVESLPPDPSLPAPGTDPLMVSTLAEEVSFLYTGPNAVQRNVASGLISEHRVATVRGKVINRNGQPLPGVRVTVLGHSEYGFTLTRENGYYDIAFNGGAPLTLVFQRGGFIETQRLVTLAWNDQKVLEPVVLLPYDSNATAIALPSPDLQLARGTVSTDDNGSRRATLMFPPGVTASLVMPDGSTTPATSLTIRATELTVGANGPRSMPASLPPNVGYTYCVELSADEAVTAGAAEVRFSAPVPLYVENFIRFPVGSVVPVGWYDRTRGVWVAAENGVVLKVLADGIDTNGDGLADDVATLTALGFSEAERQRVASLYDDGQTLWRIPVAHFSPWDANWPYGPPPGAAQPAPAPATWIRPTENSCRVPGNSVVDCHNQTLGEEIPITGTEFSLLYDSGRVARAQYRVDVPLTNDAVPPSLRKVVLTIELAGRSFRWDFAPASNLNHSFLWDGLDAYGRQTQGGRLAIINVSYVYDATFVRPGDGPRAWATTSGVAFDTDSRGDITLTTQTTAVLGHLSVDRSDLAGWMFSGRLLYDGRGRVLYQGDTNRASLPNDVRKAAFTSVAGNGDCCDSGEGGPATDAAINFPSNVAVASDGTLYLSEWTKIKRVGLDGIITTIAGNGTGGFTPDGSPALGNAIEASEVAVGPDDTLYFADRWHGRVRRIVNGILTTVAGNGEQPTNGAVSPDGRLATEVAMAPFALAAGRDGTIYVAEDRRVLAVAPDGIVRTIAGANTSERGDGGPAVLASVRPYTIAVAGDGTVYINENASGAVRRVSPDGVISLYAGSYDSNDQVEDGRPATSGRLTDVWGMSVAADGTLLIAENRRPGARVRTVCKTGVITTIAGTGANAWKPEIAKGTLALATSLNAFDVDAGPDGSVYVLDYLFNTVRKTAPLFPAAARGRLLMASADGAEAFLFEAGRHVRTIDTLTGITRHELSYDEDGRLAAVTDTDGNVTTIERGADGTPLAIVAPGGQRTTLEVKDGNLTAIANPAGERHEFTYSSGSLMASRKNPRGHVFEYTYDEETGRLIADEDPVGGFIRLSRSGTTDAFSVIRSSAEGRTHRYDVRLATDGVEQRATTAPDGTRTLFSMSRTTTTVSMANGTLVTRTDAADPRFGAMALVPTSGSVALPSGSLARWSETRTATLSNPDDPLSLTKLRRTSTKNGRTWITEYDAATRRISSSAPTGRQAFATLDDRGRMASTEIPGLASAAYSYDTRGRLRGIVWGGRRFSFDYDDANQLTAATDSLGRTVGLSYDAAGRAISQTLPGGRTIGFAYDASGNVTGITPPDRPAHTFAYTPVELGKRYTPPPVAGSGDVTATYTRDREVETIQQPDGETVSFVYDKNGQLTTVATSLGSTTYGYDEQTGQLLSVATPWGEALQYTYDGPFLQDTVWSGTVTGSVTFGYDNDLRMEYEAAAGSEVWFTFDDDGLLATAGDLTLDRDPETGFLSGTSLGAVTDAWTYNEFGEPVSYTAAFGDQTVFTQSYVRDDGGRITGLTETLYGASTQKSHGYDPAGRLHTATVAGSVNTYTYDTNGNRTNESAGYDAQDRLLTYGDTVYSYTANGERKTKTNAAGTTTYGYDAMGNLRRVDLPDGTVVEYIIDGQNRRIGKKVNGTITRMWLYAGQLRIVAELDGTGTLISRFIYGSRSNAPDYMERDGHIYRIIGDHLGSPRLVVDASTGEIAQMIGHDEFGKVLQDSNPGFQPFGFAGGLYDQHTRLSRFGARDYDPLVGRWTTQDPIGFSGGDANLYSYVSQDPINYVDPTGTDKLTSDPHVREMILDLWKRARWGHDAHEEFAWIMRDPQTGGYSCQRMPATYEANRFTIKKGALIPDNTVAVMHTHPRRRTSEPDDPGDVAFSNAFERMFSAFEALYTISQKGVGKYVPGAPRGTQEETSLDFADVATDGCGCPK